MKIMISAGEASGDLHGAGLAKELLRLDSEVELFGFGGNKMEEAGVRLVANCSAYSVMGFWEVVKNLRRLMQLMDLLTEALEEERPNLLVLIDYPDFNWRLAKRAKRLGIRVLSYIPPSAWAWRKGRAKDCAAVADAFVAIFPFELPPYREAGANIVFLGNPLVDTVKPALSAEAAREKFALQPGEKCVLLLPGSRRQELAMLFPVMLKTAKRLQDEIPSVRFYVPVAPGVLPMSLERMSRDAGVDITYVEGQSYDLMQIADVAIATSGTVVLEAALLGLPSVVLYRMSPITYQIGRMLVHVDNFSLPNILLGERVEPELLQDEAEPVRIANEVHRLLEPAEASRIRERLSQLNEVLGESGAAARIAEYILKEANQNV
ncbi:lipid-A-disaccharide synthase [Selenomonas sp. TAMA-11512]|uniref:lipid-A-disaccharide synthase n=1 Tax=Selenomonas sp. TAMA-11512 TaxID=3095337 RepID=UPI00308964E4|nr:lipid-A-disaccharide synthase [Selenomonas sp. TAMA-11512]